MRPTHNIVSFIALDLRLTILALSGELFLCLQFSFLNCSRHDSAALSPICRRSPPLSPQLRAKVRKTFAYFPKLPYLCIVNQTKQVLGDANKRINKIIICKIKTQVPEGH